MKLKLLNLIGMNIMNESKIKSIFELSERKLGASVHV